jgi:hypothetical protein
VEGLKNIAHASLAKCMEKSKCMAAVELFVFQISSDIMLGKMKSMTELEVLGFILGVLWMTIMAIKCED